MKIPCKYSFAHCSCSRLIAHAFVHYFPHHLLKNHGQNCFENALNPDKHSDCLQVQLHCIISCFKQFTLDCTCIHALFPSSTIKEPWPKTALKMPETLISTQIDCRGMLHCRISCFKQFILTGTHTSMGSESFAKEPWSITSTNLPQSKVLDFEYFRPCRSCTR